MAKNTQSQQNIPQASSMVMSFPQPPARKAEEYLDAYEGYVYTAVSAISQDVASIDLRLFKAKYTQTDVITEEVKNNEILSLLHYCNPLMSLYDLLESTSIYLDLVGEAFWVVLRDERSGKPREIWPLRPDWIKVIPDEENIISHYIYTPGGDSRDEISIPRDSVIPFKYLNPKNPYRGKGPVQAGAMAIDIHDFAQDYNRSFFFNSAIPGLVFTSEKKFSKPAIRRFIEQWTQNFSGRKKAHKVAFLGGGFKMDKVSSGGKELDFAEQSKVMRDDILAVFKVPKTVLGLTDDVNRANAEATTRAYMERVVTPRMRKMVGTLTEFYIPMWNDSATYFFDFVDPSPEDVEMKLKKYENGRKYGWLTANEIRVEENLEPLPGGDDLSPVSALGSIGSSPSGEQPDETPEEDSDGEEEKTWFSKLFGSKKSDKKVKVRVYRKQFKHMMPIPPKRVEVMEREKFQKDLTRDLTKLISSMVQNGKPKKEIKKIRPHEEIWTEEAKESYWLDFSQKATRKEVDFRRRIQQIFLEQESTVLMRLMSQLRYMPKVKRKDNFEEVLFDKEEWDARMLIMVLPFLRELINDKGNEVLDFLDQVQQFNVSSDDTLNYLQVHAGEFVSEINETTLSQLRTTLSEGVENGEALEDLRRRVQRTFKKATEERARMIASTEVLRALNFASHEAYVQSSVVVGQQWLSQRDGSVCPFCESLDGKTIELDTVFFKEGDQVKVGDQKFDVKIADVGYPPLHPRCRCTTIPVLESFRKNIAPELADDIIDTAEQKASKILNDAVKEANKMVEEAKTKAEELQKNEKDQIEIEKTETVKDAEVKAKKIVKDARIEAKNLIEEAEKEAEQKKSGILGEIKALRDKARLMIRGTEEQE